MQGGRAGHASDSRHRSYKGVGAAIKAVEPTFERVARENWWGHVAREEGSRQGGLYLALETCQRERRAPSESRTVNLLIHAPVCTAACPAHADQQNSQLAPRCRCGTCDKWRQLPSAFASSLPDFWTCADNPNAPFRSCDVPQEPDEQQLAAASVARAQA